MKRLLQTSILPVFLFTAFAAAAQTQKFGHLNSGNLLVQLPETKVADEKLKVLQDSLVAVGQQRAKTLQDEAAAFMKEYNAANVPPIDAQKKQDDFKKRQQELADFEDQVVATVAKKRDEVLSPILERVQKAITDVGKEGKFTMIFDTSVFNTILFVQQADDVEALVKAKLGIK